MQSIKVIN